MVENSKYKGLFYKGDEDIVIAETKIDSDTNTINKEASKNSKKVTYTLKNGDKYEGMEENKKRNGLGTYTFQNGEKYEGEFVDGNRHGKGTFTSSKNYEYEGEWQNNEQHGYGTCTWETGAKYEGNHKNNEQHGQGTITYTNGDQYVGHWENNKKHGFGFFIWSDGKKSEGEWKYDFMIDAPGSFGYQYTNIITKKNNDPPLPNQNNLIFYIEPIKIATLFGQFLSLNQKLFSLKKSNYDDFVITLL